MPSTPPLTTNPQDLQAGHVKWYSVAHGYGFLSADSPKNLPAMDDDASLDVFIHHSLLDEREDLLPGEPVLFAAEAGPKGLLATRIERV